MLNPKIRDQAYQFFIEEAPELLEIIEHGIINLRENRSTNNVHELMRAAHSLKGGSASVGLESIKTISHHLENIFKSFYNQDVLIDEYLEAVLLEAYDGLKTPLMEQIETNHHDPDAALAKAMPIIEAIELLLGDSIAQGDQYLPSSSDLGIDIVSSIFEVDVAQSIEELAVSIQSAPKDKITDQLKTVAEMFGGFAELLNLPGFGEICQTAMQALDANPEKSTEIAEIALINWQQARDIVLGGDRQQGGSPSPALKALAITQKSTNPTLPQIDLVDVLEHDAWQQDEVIIPPLEVPPTLEPLSLEEVFYNKLPDEPSLNNDILTISDDLSQRETSNLDEIFGTLAQEAINLDEIFGNVAQEASASLDDIFGSVAQEEALASLDDIFGSVTQKEKEAPANLDDIFGNVSPEAINLEQEFDTTPQEDEEESANLDDIFSTIPQEESADLEEIFATKAQEESANLDDVFGTLSDEPTSLDEVLFARIETEISYPQEIREEIILAAEETIQAVPSENIEQVIASVQNVFSQLPAMKEVARISQKATKDNFVKEEEEKKTQVSATLSIKVAFERLERMSNLVGELSINRNSLSLQNEQIQTTVKELLTRFNRFGRMTGKLRDLSDKLILAPLKSEQRQISAAADSSLGDFDVLEMDRYSLLYGLLQDILEEMLQLEESVDDVVLFARTSNQTLEQQRQMLQGLRDELMWARMLPLGEILGRFPRLLRDLSNKYHKPAKLQVTGQNVLVDRVALEKLYDPLVHLVRNAFDHGIERPEDRAKLGKHSEGVISIRAYHQGNQTIIEVKDDGKGLSLDKIGQQAVKAGLINSEQLSSIAKEQLSNLIFEPGFSTADQVSELSGRGVGLDVVRDQVKLLKGSVSVSSSPGMGTTFSLRIPLTMTIAKLLVCLVQTQQPNKNLAIAIPSDTIEEIIIPNQRQIKSSAESKFLYWQEKLIPIYPLQNYLTYNCIIPETFNSKAITPVPIPEEWHSPLLLIRQEQSVFALEVNRLLIEQELVVKPFGRAIASPPYSYGCTILGDGLLIPVVNAALLIEQVLQSESGESVISSSFTTQVEVPAILVVDDSATMRRTLAFTLQKAGYRVLQAKDGKEALEQLQGGAQVKMIICDVEMPNMNGFEFLGQRRQDSRIAKIPVVMLTSRGSDKHRQLANYLGATAYFTKPFIEQQFLKEIANIMTPTSAIDKNVSLIN